MFNKIVLATDGSEHSKRAGEKAVHIASCCEHSFIEVLYIIDAERAKSDVLSNWNSIDVGDARKERMKDIEHKAKEAGVEYQLHVLHGEPGPTIVNYVNKNDVDLVVIGSRGLNGLQEFVLGSVSHKVAKRANCPVLIVK
ncbi:universal stress protein [Rossellomorea sp. AcN35-11]|nr:universal stress protein [Rossellomorea aquimaris]NMH69261.1 universal stress protein [Bacillus sp. RO3]WJV29481.1 universal stress protein [Rossellomorea sp. AcN35-11]